MEFPESYRRFSLPLRLAMRLCLYAFFAIGFIGTGLLSRTVGAVYLIVLLVGGWAILRCFCSHCLYPYSLDSCLPMPPLILRRFMLPLDQLETDAPNPS
jgi:hypothetical protein